MANEVHDSLAQGLTYMRMRMSLLRDAIRRDDELRAHKFWSDVDDTLGNSQRRLRELITYFRSRMDPQGLLHALSEIQRAIPRPDRHRARIRQPRARPVPSARARDRGLPHRAGSARQHLPACAREARDGRPHPRRRRLPDHDRGRRRRHDCLSPGRGPGRAGHYGIAIMQERARRLGGMLVLGAGAVRNAARTPFPRRTGARREPNMSEPIKVVLIDDHALCRRGLSELLEARAGHQGPGDDRQRGRGRAPAARRAPGSGDHGPAHGAGRRPSPADAHSRRGHRHAGGRPHDERLAGGPRPGVSRRRARIPAEGHGSRRGRRRDPPHRAGRGGGRAGDGGQAGRPAAAVAARHDARGLHEVADRSRA